MSFFSSRRLWFLMVAPLLLVAVGAQAQTRTFKNAYISFEMLETWRCKLEQTEFVCRSEDQQEGKEAVIILTAKERGPTDSFPIYFDHLNKPIVAPARGGGTMTSNVTIAPREVMVNDQKWIDSLHINSEVQNYYTRYLATIKDQIAILVTFTSHNAKYQKHAPHFAETVKSLRVIASKDLRSGTGDGSVRGSGELFGPGTGQAMPADLLASEELGRDGAGRGGIWANEKVMALIGVLAALLLYVFIRVYRNRR
jgi:hypothetical protein